MTVMMAMMAMMAMMTFPAMTFLIKIFMLPVFMFKFRFKLNDSHLNDLLKDTFSWLTQMTMFKHF
ncbi:hypothetical protein PPE_01255 [Paenibacillus polymyxa E681]|nr:hypothetical protein PPE_01255 [Paenibacillus polymyxa E681]